MYGRYSPVFWPVTSAMRNCPFLWYVLLCLFYYLYSVDCMYSGHFDDPSYTHSFSMYWKVCMYNRHFVLYVFCAIVYTMYCSLNHIETVNNVHFTFEYTYLQFIQLYNVCTAVMWNKYTTLIPEISLTALYLLTLLLTIDTVNYLSYWLIDSLSYKLLINTTDYSTLPSKPTLLILSLTLFSLPDYHSDPHIFFYQLPAWPSFLPCLNRYLRCRITKRRQCWRTIQLL